LSTEILFSIVIPVKNGDCWLDKLFQKLLKQTLVDQTEIIVIDSGSTDNSLEIIKRYPVKLIQIPSAEFNHGETRNVGVREAVGKYIVMTVQDALPVSDLWLQFFLDGFFNNNVVAVCGQQVVPHDKDKNPVTWFRPINKPAIISYHFSNSQEFEQLTPERKKQVCGWDNVTACYRKDILFQIPFRKISFAEDMQWAKDAIISGYTLVYNGFAQVHHYHQMNKEFAFKRNLTELYYRYKILGYVPPSARLSIKQHLSIIRILLREDITLKEKWKWWVYNLNDFHQSKKAFHVFLDALNEGQMNLDKIHQDYCGVPPMAQITNR
jgi:rhamnosyltransferase